MRRCYAVVDILCSLSVCLEKGSYSEVFLCRAVKENDGACGRWWNGIRAGGKYRPCDGKEGFAVSHIVIYCYGVVWRFVYIVVGRSSSFLVELFSFFFLGC